MAGRHADQQPLVQAGQRPPAAEGDPIAQALRRAPEHGKRPFGDDYHRRPMIIPVVIQA